jgi:hypothetical protein
LIDLPLFSQTFPQFNQSAARQTHHDKSEKNQLKNQTKKSSSSQSFSIGA